MSVIVDPMNGAACRIIDKLFIDAGIDVDTVRNSFDPTFGGDTPEPVDKHLKQLIKRVKEKNVLGLALDGDADRFGVVDIDGKYIKANYALALMAYYLVNVRKISGDLTRSVATTHLIDLIAEKEGRKLIETPVGFKYLGEIMRTEETVMAAEESAGMSIKGHIPEKDGLLAVMLLTEISAYYKKSLSEVLKDMFEKYGYLKNTRIDRAINIERKKELMDNLYKNPPKSINGIKVKEVSTLDGLKLSLEDRSWILIRPSGTEPKIRTYIEASSDESFNKLTDYANKLM